MPENGRTLQCGSCNYKWFFKKRDEIKVFEKRLEINEIKEIDNSEANINKQINISKNQTSDNLHEKKNLSENLVEEISKFTKEHNTNIDKNFSVIVNQGPGSFSSIRISIAVAKGLEISKKVKIYGYNSVDLRIFDKENVENLVNSNLIEKKLIKPIYLS